MGGWKNMLLLNHCLILHSGGLLLCWGVFKCLTFCWLWYTTFNMWKTVALVYFQPPPQLTSKYFWIVVVGNIRIQAYGWTFCGCVSCKVYLDMLLHKSAKSLWCSNSMYSCVSELTSVFHEGKGLVKTYQSFQWDHSLYSHIYISRIVNVGVEWKVKYMSEWSVLVELNCSHVHQFLCIIKSPNTFVCMLLTAPYTNFKCLFDTALQAQIGCIFIKDTA